MPTFLHPALLWGLGIAAIPVLIHLINMMRHRRVEWAAMEFLLVSQKKHRSWILFKQLLLLLMRMAIIAGVVFMVAQPRLRGQWSGLLGGSRTHHIVLLDDSFSMSDRWGDTDAFGEAKKVVSRIAADAVRQDHVQWFTLARFSRVGSAKQKAGPDLTKAPVSREFGDKLNAALAKMKVSETAAEPLPTLEAVGKLLGENEGERRIVYLVSDFRTRQWNDPTDLRKELKRWNEAGAELRLVDCVDRARPNLAIVSLAPVAGIRAAGVSWFMEVAVKNFGTAPAKQVSVTLGEDGHGRPAVTLAEIPPGQIAKERFEVRFANAGSHEITARLESDSVAADNFRYCAVDSPADLPALLIDSDPRGANARYLNFALSPGEPVRTGIRPAIETPRFLSLKSLGDFQSIIVTNIDRLDSSAVEALEKYVAGGGGVAFFLGDRTDARFFNDMLYRNGQGLFPVPLKHEAELPIDRLEPAPDVQIEGHFVFRVFGGKQNSLLPTLAVRRYFAVADGWRPPTESGVRVAAQLRNGAPLAVERRFGKGRVLAFLTSAAPTWNNWAKNPSFVVAMQDLQAYLAERPSTSGAHLVGSPLEVTFDAAAYQSQIRVIPPEDSGTPSAMVNAVRNPDGMLVAAFADVAKSGFYEVQLTKTSGEIESRHYAVNVDASEGDLKTVDGPKLAKGLEGVKFQFDQAAAFQLASGEAAGSNLAQAILFAVVALLIGEQLLAWSASYHPSARWSRANVGQVSNLSQPIGQVTNLSHKHVANAPSQGGST
jgi:hypothetical protein